MQVTAPLETRKVLTRSWENLKGCYETYGELLNREDSLTAAEKKQLRTLREKICRSEFDRVESPSLRIRKFLHIGDNSKRFECDALARLSKRPNDVAKLFAVSAQTPDEVRIVLKLQGRMMLNRSGGILENAGLCLHPHAGVPYIPGTAVKGVSRHAAWCEWADAVDEGRDNAARENAMKSALTFGFPSNEEGFDRYCSDQWPLYFGERAALGTHAGLFAFMPAMPIEKTELVTDIVNGHHSEYYAGKLPRALGIENHNPQFFPAVERGAMFSFVLRPMRRCERILDSVDMQISKDDLCRFAEDCLRRAATDFGFGAQTSSGYGWFDEDWVREQALAEKIQKEKQVISEKEEQKKQENALEEDQKRQKEQKERRETELKRLSPGERALREVEEWEDRTWGVFLGTVGMFSKLGEQDQRAVVLTLAGREAHRWEKLKQKALSGKKKDKIARPMVEKIRSVAKRQDPRVELP